MTTTDELRRLLDERGVEYTFDHGYREFFWDFGESGRARASAIGTKGLVQMIVTGITPAQAIAATLGTGTCHDKGNIERFICSECGCRLDLQDDDWEATMWLDGAAMVPNFCPNCGRRVVDE